MKINAVTRVFTMRRLMNAGFFETTFVGHIFKTSRLDSVSEAESFSSACLDLDLEVQCLETRQEVYCVIST